MEDLLELLGELLFEPLLELVCGILSQASANRIAGWNGTQKFPETIYGLSRTSE